ncbi:hypothetical protein AKJ57_00135 [candidate division MSBL1 archaeon SCGC-AAA259A05]|uniref:Uncharacterized protein n=1 Tax=candidate division MSBL1 archaeon SCGC-AAA259A05 TaxID=1698259 RepID=A0A133UC09_9EURY|nr:hypothetical protein AKJ57_00135 [candidate division MSBL1 archaeon SCGC-AAA259A05]
MKDFLLDYSNSREALLDEDLAKLGDALANLIYSLARSRARGRPDGAKAPNRVLSGALDKVGLRNLAPSRVDRHRLGDVAEAAIAFAWLEGEVGIEEAAEVVSGPLMERDFESRRDVQEGAEEGFKELLRLVAGRLGLEGV